MKNSFFSKIRKALQPLDKSLARRTALGFLFVSVLGTLSHFFYEWSQNNPFIGLFSPVSESTWEHIKLLFFPMLLYVPLLKPHLKYRYPNLASAWMLGLLLGCGLIPALFYTYTGILGYSVPPVDISIFYVSVAAAFRFIYRFAQRSKPIKQTVLLRAAILLLAVLFFWFTFAPPSLGLFRSP